MKVTVRMSRCVGWVTSWIDVDTELDSDCTDPSCEDCLSVDAQIWADQEYPGWNVRGVNPAEGVTPEDFRDEEV